jgi:hypothetical protein
MLNGFHGGREQSVLSVSNPFNRLKLRWALVCVALLVTLAACGGGVTQTSQTEHYKVQLSLDGTGFGERTATIEVQNLAGAPVTADQVMLSSTMRQMGMAVPDVVAQPIAPGRYQARGEFFSMIGEWDVDVRVSVGGAEEVANFKTQVSQ